MEAAAASSCGNPSTDRVALHTHRWGPLNIVYGGGTSAKFGQHAGNMKFNTYLLTPWSRVLLEKLTSKLCS